MADARLQSECVEEAVSTSSPTGTPLPNKLKILMLGDDSVGKTSLVTRFMYDSFDSAYRPTIGIDWLSKTMYVEEEKVRPLVYDASGQERFRSLVPSYIRDSSAVVLVYDVTRSSSLHGTSKWFEAILASRGEEALIILVGNKCDLGGVRQVDLEEGQKKALEFKALHFEASAKDGKNVRELFAVVASGLVQKIRRLPRRPTKSMSFHKL